MSELVVSYAKALYSLATDMKTEDKILSQMKEISDALKENPDFIKLLNSPALSLEERHRVAEDAFGNAEEILVNFIKLLTEGRLMHLFQKCERSFENEYNIFHSIEVVTVESAYELSDGQLKALRDKLESMTGKQIELKSLIRPELLGGIVVKMRGVQYDGSISKKLDDIFSDIHNVIV